MLYISQTSTHITPEGDVVSYLSIVDLQISDGGRFTCRANNSVGVGSETMNLNVYGMNMRHFTHVCDIFKLMSKNTTFTRLYCSLCPETWNSFSGRNYLKILSYCFCHWPLASYDHLCGFSLKPADIMNLIFMLFWPHFLSSCNVVLPPASTCWSSGYGCRLIRFLHMWLL